MSISPRINSRGKVLFGGQYVVSGQTSTNTAIYHFDRTSGLHEALNSQTMVDGSTSASWRINQSITDTAEVAVTFNIATGNRRSVGVLRLDRLFASGID